MRRMARWLLTGCAVVAGAVLIRQAARPPASPSVPSAKGQAAVAPPNFSLVERTWATLAQWIDRSIGWESLPPLIGDLVLAGVRIRLRQTNLHDTGKLPSIGVSAPVATDDRYLTARTADGTFNDLSTPLMGAVNTRFGRNVPLEDTVLEDARALLTPSPR